MPPMSGATAVRPSGLGRAAHPPVREALILCGGAGTRLRPSLPTVPKILAPIAGRPFIAYQLRVLASLGLERVILCTGYLAETVRAALGDRQEGMALVYSREETPLDTGGAVRLALPHITGESVLVLNGDSYLDADLSSLVAPRAEAPACLMAVVALADTARFGRIVFCENGVVVAFSEKGQSGPGYINAGVYRFTRQALGDIEPGRPVSLEREIFPGLVGQGLSALPLAGAFLDIGTPQSYAAAEEFFASVAAGRD